MAYSDVEIKAFAERDKRIVRQSSLKVAADLVIAVDKGKSNLATLNLATQTVAQELTDWVYEKDQDVAPAKGKPDNSNPQPDNQQLPEPTLAQKKVLDAIYDKVDHDLHTYEYIKISVLQWAETVHKQRSYPTKLDSVETFLKWFNN